VTPAEKLALRTTLLSAFNAGLDIEALIPLYHPDCEWRMGHIGAAAGTDAYRGHEGLRQWVAALHEGFESFTVVIDEARITTDGGLLLRNHGNGRTRGTHMDLSTPEGWQEAEFREGLCVTVVEFHQPPPAWDEATPIV
jgi:SnoaL-like domain